MHIILGKEIAEELRQRHVVLELETFNLEGKPPVTAFCVVPAEKIVLTEMPDIERYGRLHQATVDAWNQQRFDTVVEGISHLRGHFGGELDTFYDILLQAIEEKQVDTKSED